MAATLHETISPSKPETAAPAKYSDFVLGPGRPIDGRVVLDETGWFPYCADGRLRRAIFVRLPDDIDLSKVPFVSIAQFEGARQVITMSFEDLAELAATVPVPAKIIFVFSIGRCGSTLTAKVLDQAAGVWSLSEPDIYAGLAMSRSEFSDDDVDLIISAGTRLLFASAATRGFTALSVKMRSQSLLQASDFHQCFPDAKFLFLYRDPEGWAKSFYHFMHSVGHPPVLDPGTQRHLWMMLSGDADPGYLAPYIQFPQESLGLYQLLAPAWMFFLEEYSDLRREGVPFHAVRYESYKSGGAAVAEDIFAHCDIRNSDPAALHAVFERHSQQGTFLDVAPTEDHFSPNRSEYSAIIRRSPRFPDIRALVAEDGLFMA